MEGARPTDAPPVRIDAANEWAWCGARRLELPPRTFALLRFLVEHPGRLLTKDDIFAAVWRDTVVSEAALTSCIRDLRKALGDSSAEPRYIATVHRRGFRFVGPVAAASAGPAHAPVPMRATAPTFVGRDAELARLHALLATAMGGERRVVFVTGEAGIGKSTLVETFLSQLGQGDGLRVGRGQCVEQYGAGEPYLPVLEALGRMGREPGGDALVSVLKQFAPTWLAQLPALLGDADLEAVHRRAQGTTRERMLREVIEALEAMSAATPLVLVLEDLHWCDPATVELLAMLARRRDPARLLIVGTHRPVDVAAAGHPLGAVMQELRVHGACEELALRYLDEAAVAAYLAGRFPSSSFEPAFVRQLHDDTGGNPLFLVNVIDHLIAQGQVREKDGAWTLAVPVEDVGSGVPKTLWQMVETQVERLALEEQEVLSVGSVAGAEFSAALSSVDGIDPAEGDRICDALARRGQFLRATGVVAWPDGTVAGGYAFIHALYRDVLYARIPIGHRVGLHLRMGARIERAQGAHADDVAGELAMHFEHGRDFERAVHYRRQAADVALRRHAYRAAVEHATRAIELLSALPESPERDREELPIQTMLGAAVIATNGWAAPDVAKAYARASELCTRTGVTSQLFPVLVGLAGFYTMRGELAVAAETSRRLLVHAEKAQDAAGLLGGHNVSGLALFYGGDFVTALSHFERAKTFYDPERHSPNRQFSVDHDPGISCASHTALTLQMLGHPDRAAACMRECLAAARALDHPPTVAMAYNFAATFHQIRREPRAVQEIEDVRLEYATRHDFDLFLLLGDISRGWLVAEEGRPEEGLVQIRQGLAAFQMIGAELGRPTFLGIEATVLGQLGCADEGLAVVRDALALGEATGLRYWDAELRRLQGELTLASETRSGGSSSEAEACFLDSIEIARRQQAKTLELRTAMSLGRLWARSGKAARARTLLSEVYESFEEGFDTPDLADAKALIAQLGATRRR